MYLKYRKSSLFVKTGKWQWDSLSSLITQDENGCSLKITVLKLPHFALQKWPNIYYEWFQQKINPLITFSWTSKIVAATIEGQKSYVMIFSLENWCNPYESYQRSPKFIHDTHLQINNHQKVCNTSRLQTRYLWI